MFRRTKVCTGLMLAFGGTLAMSVPPALAQQTLERVEITGSNIRRVQSETASPVQVITRDDIERSGKATVGEYLQTLSVDNQGSIPTGFGNGFASGSIGVSLRGLGSGSTLVLLNGRRMAPYGLADDGQKIFTDLSTVPVEAVERVEVLKDGASAIYGSDAIAGVVNIILRKDFTGVIGKASYGTSRYKDGDETKASITAGFGDLNADRYNVWFNLEALKAQEIRYGDRDRKWIGDSDTRKWGYAQGGSFFTPVGDITTGGAAAGSSLVGNIRVGGVFQSLPGCGQNFPTVTPPDPDGGCLYNAGKLYNWLRPEQEAFNLFTRGTLKLGNDHEAFAEVGYSKKSSYFQNTPSGVSGSWGFPGGAPNASSGPGAVVLHPTHPDNPGGAGDRLRYAAGDVGPRTTDVSNEFTRFVVGLEGNVANWYYKTAFMHSQTDLSSVRNGFLRYSVVRAALGDPTSIYFPWRIGINSNLNSPDLYAALAPEIRSDGKSKLTSIDLNVQRELMNLAGGPLAVAFGAEFRREDSSLTPVTYTDIGDIIGLGYSAFEGKRDLFAAYAEVVAPVIKDLELSAALRHDRYEGGLNSTTPKLGVKFSPIRQLALRGTYAEGFRAPNAAEGGTGGVSAFTTARDPVRCPDGTPAAGANAQDCGLQIAIITTGNPNLKPEKSKSYTLGLVFEPLSGTSVALDVWQIKRSDEINQPTAAQAIAAGNFVRSDDDLAGIPNSGTLLAAIGQYVNSASSTVKGWDMDLKQRWALGDIGRVTGSVVWTHIDSWKRTEPDGTTFEFAGTHDNCDVTNCIGTVKDRVNVGLTWDRGAYQVTGLLNYFGSLKNYAFQDYENCAHTFADGSPAPAGCKIPSFYTFDLSGRWSPTKNLEVFGSIQNLFDKVAPLDPTTYGAVNFNPLHVSGAIGRYYTVGLKYKFF
jgi:iron complex outermembrane recepter protein